MNKLIILIAILLSSPVLGAQTTTVSGPGAVSGSPTGAAGGDLGGTYPNPTTVASHVISAGPINGAVISSGLIGDFRFTEGSGTTVGDSSGSGNAGTFGAGGNAPTWISPTPGISVVGASNQVVSFPLAMSQALSTGGTVQVFVSTSATGVYRTNPMIIGSSGFAVGAELGFYQTSGVNNDFAPSVEFSNVYKVVGSDAMGGNHLITWVIDSTNDQLYIDQNPMSFYGSSANGSTGQVVNSQMYLGGVPVSNGLGANGGFTGSFYRMLVYNRKLSITEIQNNYFAITNNLQALGVNLNPSLVAADGGNYFVALGDSITAGVNGANSWTTSISPTLSYNVKNEGTSGYILQNILAEINGRAGLFCGANHARNVYAIFAGTNDMASGSQGGTFPTVSAANAFGRLISVTQALKQKCPTAKIIWIPMISRSGTGFGAATNESLKITYDNLMRANWERYVDLLADVANDPNLGANAADQNATYFQGGGTHPNNTGAALLGGYVNTAINILEASEHQQPVVYTSGPTTMADIDLHVDADTTSGAFTLTLPTCLAKTGMIYTIKNIAAVNILTLADFSAGQTIDGMASFALNSISGVRIKAEINTPVSSAGCHWEIISVMQVPQPNCVSSASPAVCGASPTGFVALPTGAVPTLVVNTTKVTANSTITLTVDESLGAALGVTCNTTLSTLLNPVVTARTANTSFTFTINSTLAVNPACISYTIIN